MGSFRYETWRKILRFNFTVQDLPHEISLRKALCLGASRIAARDLAEPKRRTFATPACSRAAKIRRAIYRVKFRSLLSIPFAFIFRRKTADLPL